MGLEQADKGRKVNDWKVRENNAREEKYGEKRIC